MKQSKRKKEKELNKQTNKPSYGLLKDFLGDFKSLYLPYVLLFSQINFLITLKRTDVIKGNKRANLESSSVPVLRFTAFKNNKKDCIFLF